MVISDYIAKLREKIGNDLLLLPSVGAVIFDAQRRVLLQQHATTLAGTPGAPSDPAKTRRRNRPRDRRRPSAR